MITDRDYNALADNAYEIDKNKAKHPIRKGDTIDVEDNNKILSSFEVLKVKDNTENGMQAMAVAPLDKNGKADTSQVVIAYAGTNADDDLDVLTDVQTVGLGKDTLTTSTRVEVPSIPISLLIVM